MSGWSLHACWRDPICRKYGATSRLQLSTPVGALTIAFRRDDWLQLWLPWKTRNPLLPIEKFPDQKTHYSRWWSPIVWEPRRKKRS
jgi:hypothetical protein